MIVEPASSSAAAREQAEATAIVDELRDSDYGRLDANGDV